MDSFWRLLGELHRARSRDEIGMQYVGDWNPWSSPWNRRDEPDIVLSDPQDCSRSRHVHVYYAYREGVPFRFAARQFENGTWRFYIPAQASDDQAIRAVAARYEGFWCGCKDDKSDLPWPESVADWPGRIALLVALDRVEANAERIAYRGYSPCRLCKCGNGFESLPYAEWEWPAGFRHYVSEHLVRPSADFEKFIRSSGASRIIEAPM